MPVARLLTGGGSGTGSQKWHVPIFGAINGSNKTYTTPDFFDPTALRLYRNGDRQHQGTGNDYTVLESGGLGTGYDTIIFEASVPAPITGEILFVDYVVAP